MRRLLWLVWLPCLTKAKPRRPRQQEDSSAPPWLTDSYLPDASKFAPAHQPNNHNQRGRREATRLDAELALVSFHADVSILAECDAFVGTGKASVGKVALLSMIARLGVVPPFVLLDGPPRQLLRRMCAV